MRRLIVTRGLPGSGKSTTLSDLGLTDFTIGADVVRLLLASPILTPDGRMAISPQQDSRVWSKMHEILGDRMQRGELVVMDATHPKASDFEEYVRLAREHRYRVACLDFSGVPADVSNWGNDGRAEHRVVPPHAVERISASMAAGQVPEGVSRVMVRSDRSHLAEMRTWLDVPMLDLNAEGYERVVHVGDVQGCHTAMMAVLEGGLRDDTFYVFVGDICDRGEENGAALRWVLDNVAGRPNARILFGNHELHLHKQAVGLPPVSREFAAKTLPQLRAAGITDADLDKFCEGLEDMVLYQLGRDRVMVTHGGLSTVPRQPWMLPSRQCAHGTGFYEDDVDTQFERNAPPGWFQVHGHRNSHLRPVRATPRSFNLEAAVEAGGQMRALIHDLRGFHPVEVTNHVFRPFRLRSHRKMTIVPPWMDRDEADGTIMAPELRAAMAAHPEVRERQSEAFPNVVSLNFTKKVFFDGSFDSVTVKARGMFVDRETREIVSRSYDKFFNIGERPETSLEGLRESLRFPVTGWLKENGFLGTIGYDRRSDGLFVSSKSTTEGDFAGWAREILNTCIPSAGHREALRRFLRDCEASIPMEVIDPVRDPHIIEYEAPKVVFLDCLRRSTEFERLPHDDLVRLGKEFGVEVKQRAFTLPSWQAFEAWHRRASQDMSKKIEGYVIEDASGNQVKFKTPYYAFWKLCRGQKDSIVRERDGGRVSRGLDQQFLETRGLGFLAPLAESFKDWCREQDTETLRGDIISLRHAFEGDLAPETQPSAGPGPRRA